MDVDFFNCFNVDKDIEMSEPSVHAGELSTSETWLPYQKPDCQAAMTLRRPIANLPENFYDKVWLAGPVDPDDHDEYWMDEGVFLSKY